MKVLLTAGALIAGAALTPALYAGEADGKRQQRDRSMMGEGMMGGGMMGGKMMGRGMMGQGMMDHCAEMMQGGTDKPNDQWRKNAPTAPDEKG
jgi:hypothetical protein